MPYQSKCDWIKLKCPSWRGRNREPWRLFDRPYQKACRSGKGLSTSES